MRLKFGKFEGHELSDPEVDTSYLEWLLRSQMATIQDIEAELARREHAEAESVPLAERMLTAGYRALCESCGNDENALRELKGTRAALEEVLESYFTDQVKTEAIRRMGSAREERKQILKWKQGS